MKGKRYLFMKKISVNHFLGEAILKYCKNCGTKLKPGEIYCSNCGMKIEHTEKENDIGNGKSSNKTNNTLNNHDNDVKGSFNIVDDNQPKKINKKAIAIIVGIILIGVALLGYHNYSTSVNHVVTGKAYNIYGKTSNMKTYKPIGYLVFGKGTNKGKVVWVYSKSKAIAISRDNAKFSEEWTKASNEERDDVDYTFNKERYTATKSSLKITAYMDDSDSSVNNSLTVLSLHNMKVSGGTINGTGTATTTIYEDGDTDSFNLQAILKPANY